MRIKKLEIVGFKSFAECARLNFGEGITGVVGPNGCGKSNIVDAIRWCMGEMSAKHLRGRAMQDVIFAGSDSHGPQGMAEVTLTFDNDGSVPSRYLNYSEVAVTRRLFRDGTSEYLLNKTPVRLRDVTDLFLGTGVGTRAYSIIEQGRIGFVVNSRPEDRRTLIEEVAGITKFKVRKKAAERRMEATEQNLSRIGDVVSELERQLQSLRRQAKKAERYKELRCEQRDLDLHLAAMDMLRLTAMEKVHHAALSEAQNALQAAQQGLTDEESQVETRRQTLVDEERALLLRQEASAAHDAALAALDRDLSHWRREAAGHAERLTQGAAELETARARMVQAEEERQSLRGQAASLREAAQNDAAAFAEARGAVEAGSDALAAIDEELELARRQALQHVQGAEKERARVAALQRQQEQEEVRGQAAAEEQQTLQVSQAAATARHAERERERDAVRAQLAARRERLAFCKEALPTLQARVKAAASAVSTVAERMRQKRSRLTSLQEIARRFEGYSDGVRTLLGPKHKGPLLPGIESLVAHVLEVPDELEAAIEAALGERLQVMLVRDAEVGVKAIEHLRNAGGGRGGFLPPQAAVSPLAPPPADPAVVGTASDLVVCAPEHRYVLEALLGNVLVVATLPDALRLRASLPGWVCVSRDGSVVDAAGVLSGGAKNGAGLLANRREIRALISGLEVDEQERQSLQAQSEAAEAERAALTAEIASLQRDIHAMELQELSAAKDCQSAAAELQRTASRLSALQEQQRACAERAAALDADVVAATRAARAAQSGHEEAEQNLAELQERRHVSAQSHATRAEQLTAIKVRRATGEEKLAATEAAELRLGRTLEDLSARITRTEAAMAHSSAEAEALAARLEEGAARWEATQAEAHAQHAALREAREAYEARVGELSELERTLKEQRKGSEALHEAITASKMEIQRLALERQQLTEQLTERHDVAVSEVIADYHLRPAPGRDAKKRVAELERTIRNLGPINLTAIDECAEVETRYEFLVRQRDDLQEALEALRRAIGRINRASRDRFREAFDAVNEMFQKVYPRLFRGGVARLELIGSDDLLDAGVDIVAMPPGKKLQNVGLLSGGEKALTATALVFAIFLIKPSPFCILDEVDAPLDEANVGRFNDMLREISKVSQFIVITHNKQTMLQADRLYGITMEEPGMSKVVAVDLEDARKGQAA